MTREQIEEICPVIDIYRKSPKECWVLGYEAALRAIEAESVVRFLESFKDK